MLDVNNRMVDLNQNMLDANKQLLQLGNKNFDENATVKIVTLVTLIYLPASLVSVSSSNTQHHGIMSECPSTLVRFGLTYLSLFSV